MIHDIQTFSRQAIEIFDPPRPGRTAILSFRDPGTDVPIFRRVDRDQICLLEFHDIDTTPPNVDLSGYTLFNASHAERAAAFVQAMDPRVETLLVHCEAGISRSVSAAIAIAHVLRLRPNPMAGRNIYNLRVYSGIKKALTEARALTA